MNSLERVLAAYQGQATDCVPVEPGIGHYAALLAKKPLTEVLRNPELMAEVVLEAWTRHGYDRVCPITDWGLSSTSMGCKVEIKEWEHARVVEAGVNDKSDLAKLKVPNPLKDDRTPVVIECERIFVDAVGEHVHVNGAVAGPLSFASILRGTDTLMMDLIEDPAFVHDLTVLSLEVCKTFGEAQITTGGVRTIFIYEPLSTLISESMVDEFSFSYLRDLVAHLKGLGVSIHLHICGDVTRLLERMVKVGVDSIAAHAPADLAEWKRVLGDQAVIYGNIATEKIARMSAEEVYEEACACIRAAAQGGRYVLSSECEVPLDAPPENIDAMVRAAREYGAEFLAR